MRIINLITSILTDVQYNNTENTTLVPTNHFEFDVTDDGIIDNDLSLTFHCPYLVITLLLCIFIFHIECICFTVKFIKSKYGVNKQIYCILKESKLNLPDTRLENNTKKKK